MDIEFINKALYNLTHEEPENIDIENPDIIQKPKKERKKCIREIFDLKTKKEKTRRKKREKLINNEE